MCSISVEPIPSMISRRNRSSQRRMISGGNGSAADTHSRTESSAPSAEASRESAP